MKKLLLLFMLMYYVSANAQTDCSIYRKGYFIFTNSLGNTILVQRKQKYQCQYNRKTKVRTQFVIKWDKNCEYSITQTLTNSKSLGQYKNSITATVIPKPDGANGYYYACNCKDEDIGGEKRFIKKITKQEFL
jgi:hypothetical protein